MRAPVSVIIPTLDAAEELPGALACLMEGLEAGVVRELVISDGGSSDATLAIAEEVGAVVVRGAAGRGGQLARGAAVAGGPWLLFLHADTCLRPGWAEVVTNHIGQSDRAAYFRLAFRAPGLAPRIVAAWANLRARAGLPFGDQGLLLPRALYQAVGGFPDIPLMEDVALARALRGRLQPLPAAAETGAGRYLRNGWVRQGAANWWRLARFFAGADPAKLARRYDR